MKRRQRNLTENSAQLADARKGGAGSPDKGEPLFLAVGSLRRPHGVKGEIVMEVLTDFPERLKVGKTLFIGEERQGMQLSSLRWHDKALLVRFEGYTDREAVGRLRNALVYVRSDDLPALPEGEYYHHQLLGLTVVNEAGVILGALEAILETGANDVYLVRGEDGSELLLPSIAEVILAIDLERQQILVRPQQWW